MANVVMGLCASTDLRHVVELSESPFCHYTYSNVPKVMNYWHLSDAKFDQFIAPYLPEAGYLASGRGYYHVSHDFTKLPKPHSPALAGRGYVVASNPVAGNSVAGKLSLSAGYAVAVLHLHLGGGGLVPPLRIERLAFDSDRNFVALSQLASVLGSEALALGAMPGPKGDLPPLAIFTADAEYGKARFLSPLRAHEQVVGIIRVRTGAPRIYGDVYYLRPQSQTLASGKGKGKVQRSITGAYPR
jgi:hypothetical protein